MSSLILPIETDRLILRCFEQSDLVALSDYHALPSMHLYAIMRMRDRDEMFGALNIICDQISLQRSGKTLTPAMTVKTNGKLIGHVSLD